MCLVEARLSYRLAKAGEVATIGHCIRLHTIIDAVNVSRDLWAALYCTVNVMYCTVLYGIVLYHGGPQADQTTGCSNTSSREVLAMVVLTPAEKRC